MADNLYTEARKRADETIDEQAILDKYNAATVAQFNAQREQNRINENQFYNQMYNTQRTAMDTIRQSNAAAVATGASRGVQAAQELSSLLGLQQESVASATELAQANRQTAQEETAAVLENVLNAYKEAEAQKQQAVTQEIQAASVESEREAAAAQTESANAQLLTQAAENGTATYLTALSQAGIDYSDGTVTPESQTSLEVALSNIGKTKEGTAISFNADDWKGGNSGAAKADTIVSNINNICDAYGLDKTKYQAQLNALKTLASNTRVSWIGYYDADEAAQNTLGVSLPDESVYIKTDYAKTVEQGYQNILTQIRNDYSSGANRKSKK